MRQGQKNRTKWQCNAKQKERDGPPVQQNAEEKYACNCTLVFTSTSAAQSHVARSGYIGLNKCTEAKKEYLLNELLEMGFDVLKWDGRYA